MDCYFHEHQEQPISQQPLAATRRAVPGQKTRRTTNLSFFSDTERIMVLTFQETVTVGGRLLLGLARK
jgi:hypothetical protein